jgi:hypothetical protein
VHRPVPRPMRPFVQMSPWLAVLAALSVAAASCRSSRPGATARDASTDRKDGPAAAAAPASDTPHFASPEPAERVTLGLSLEDNGEVTLVYSLPGAIRFECRELVHRIVPGPDRVDIVISGIAPLDPKSEEGSFCRMVKEPSPFHARLRLPMRTWRHLAFHWGSHVDRYTLAVEADRIELAPVGQPAFTEPSETGRLLRAGADWLWVGFWFLGEDSRRRLADKRDALLRELEELGAVPFEPSPGTYLLAHGTYQTPRDDAVQSPDASQREIERFFFHFSGDWKAVEKLAARYKKYNPPVRYRSTNMTVWLSQRNRVVTTH